MKLEHRMRTIAVIVMLAFLAGCRREPPEKKFQYDLSSLTKTDPSSLLCDQVAELKTDVAEPHGIAVDEEDHIFVCGSQSVGIYDAKGTKLEELALSAAARCIAVDGNGDLFLGTGNHVTILDGAGNGKAEWTPHDPESFITSIALGEDVFVADAGKRVVLRYNRKGELLARIEEGDPAQAGKGFIIPSPYFDLAMGRGNSIWVVNPGRHALQNYGPDGTLQTSWRKRSMAIDGFCGCCNPSHIALLSDGSFVTSEKGLPRIKIYDPQGEFVGVVAGTDRLGEDTPALDIAIDSAGRILALDPKLSAVRVFVRRRRGDDR
jgi:hypothetical protein